MFSYDMSYSPETRTLTANFNQRSWKFFGVPPNLYDEMMRASSKKDYFNTRIWNSFEYRRNYENIAEFLGYVKENALTFSNCDKLDVYSLDWDGDTLLHLACRWGDISAVELLLREGANIGAKDYLGWTALHAAEWSGHVLCANVLLAAGATPVEFLP